MFLQAAIYDYSDYSNISNFGTMVIATNNKARFRKWLIENHLHLHIVDEGRFLRSKGKLTQYIKIHFRHFQNRHIDILIDKWGYYTPPLTKWQQFKNWLTYRFGEFIIR